MLRKEELESIALRVPQDPDGLGLLATLRARAAPVLGREVHIPRVKALLSRDGGFCPRDGATLRFDPWSPERHTCPRCGQATSGDRHYRNWARAQHLWIAERAAELALLAGVESDPRAAERAVELLAVYEELYFELENRDNVLGPSHLFFSTYLESLWLTSYLAAAFQLRELGQLPEARADGVSRVSEEAALLIGEFDEGHSNRQVWHAAALCAIATWFDDPELAYNAVESGSGLLGQLVGGFGDDGMWREGENYHLFALRGLMQGIHWARAGGFDLLDDERIPDQFRKLLLAPSLTALPDLTYPARRDSRYGVSLAQPASLELWEIGRSWLDGDAEIEAWLAALYAVPELPAADHYDAWLHDAGRPAPPRYTRDQLSWWTLSALSAPSALTVRPPDRPTASSTLLHNQGLAILRRDASYASLECGSQIGGHGHPDLLHLTLHAAGVHWLPDPGTGSYVHPTLAWYRSALAHNAPRLNGANAGGDAARCAAFEAGERWSWCSAESERAHRSIVLGESCLIDRVRLLGTEAGEWDLAWHLQGDWRVVTPGRWEKATLDHPQVTRVERFVPEGSGPLVAKAGALTLFLHAPGAELLRAMAPGLPTRPEPAPFLLQRQRTATGTWTAVLDWAAPESSGAVRAITADDVALELTTAAGPLRCQFGDRSVTLTEEGKQYTLAGARPASSPFRPIFETRPSPEPEGRAPLLAEPPALDGTLEGFDQSEPLYLNTELQYRRSEEPYEFDNISAEAWVNWDAEALYLAVAVRKPELVFRSPAAEPLLLDNEPDDIHSDGLQVYWRTGTELHGFLVVPREDGTIAARNLAGGELEDQAVTVDGRWQRTEEGYLVTLRLADPELEALDRGTRIGFDIVVNEMQPGRVRRAGQLVWSSGGGWVYLRGDRHELVHPENLELG